MSHSHPIGPFQPEAGERVESYARKSIHIPSARGCAPRPTSTAASSRPLIKRLRHPHYLLARLLAEGRPVAEVGMITGYSPHRISALQKDPKFAELVVNYRDQVQAQYREFRAKAQEVRNRAVALLEERLPAPERNN